MHRYIGIGDIGQFWSIGIGRSLADITIQAKFIKIKFCQKHLVSTAYFFINNKKVLNLCKYVCVYMCRLCILCMYVGCVCKYFNLRTEIISDEVKDELYRINLTINL